MKQLNCSFNWLGYGLTITDGSRETFFQGDEAAELHDALGSCDESQQACIISEHLDSLEVN